ncbi:MAG: hypothetical protein AAF902_09955 [Chloroflexota bacterium]
MSVQMIMILGGLMIILGVLARLLTGTKSITALIPVFFGVPIAILGYFIQNNPSNGVLIIITAVLGLLGAAGSATVVRDLAQGKGTPASQLSRALMLLFCFYLLAVCYSAYF